ncbi:MAG TPA: hypothetical protein VFC31_15175 [Candidatus Limnocylindria bacterium]|nr:hypothetical protein [Candidatus Limnocylindria bacterium]
MSQLARDEGLVTEPADTQVLSVLELYVLWLGRYPMPLKTRDWLDLIPYGRAGDDPLRFDDERAQTLFESLVRHEEMNWYP